MEMLRHVPSESCTTSTAQTSGMTRMAALSGDTVGSRAIWMGETHMAPRAASGPHHHGAGHTRIYVVPGHPEFIYKEVDRGVRVRTKPGDYIYIPPSVHHIESNAHSDEEAVVVIARSTQEAIVENRSEEHTSEL